MMITDENKKQIESLPLDEMLYEINLGHRSRFQKEKFAYLQTCYQSRIAELSKTPNITTGPSPNIPDAKQDSGNISLYKIAEGVIIAILIACIFYLIKEHFGLHL